MKTNTWQEYEQEMLQHTTGYTVTEFKGRGSYETRPFKRLRKAQEWYRLVKKSSPDSKILIYAVCQPPNRQLTVSLPVSDFRYELNLV